MGTRSRVAVMHGDNCKSIYCHWDGYLEYNGKLLQEHYDSAKANNLVALGDMSSLGANIGTQHAFDKAPEGECTFYMRDRNETGCEFQTDATFESFLQRVKIGGTPSHSNYFTPSTG